MGARQCAFILDSGKQCEAYAIGDGELCFNHEPRVAPARARARRNGGLNRRVQFPEHGPVPAVEGVGDVLAICREALGTAWALEGGERRVRALVSVGSLAIKALEVSELEERLQAIEHRLNARVR